MSPNLHFCKSSHDGHDGHDGPSLSSSMMVTILLLFCPSCILGEVVASWSLTRKDSVVGSRKSSLRTGTTTVFSDVPGGKQISVITEV